MLRRANEKREKKMVNAENNGNCWLFIAITDIETITTDVRLNETIGNGTNIKTINFECNKVVVGVALILLRSERQAWSVDALLSRQRQPCFMGFSSSLNGMMTYWTVLSSSCNIAFLNRSTPHRKPPKATAIATTATATDLPEHTITVCWTPNGDIFEFY